MSWGRWYPFFRLSFFSGARTGEALTNGVISPPKSLQPGGSMLKSQPPDARDPVAQSVEQLTFNQ